MGGRRAHTAWQRACRRRADLQRRRLARRWLGTDLDAVAALMAAVEHTLMAEAPARRAGWQRVSELAGAVGESMAERLRDAPSTLALDAVMFVGAVERLRDEAADVLDDHRAPELASAIATLCESMRRLRPWSLPS